MRLMFFRCLEVIDVEMSSRGCYKIRTCCGNVEDRLTNSLLSGWLAGL